MAQVKTPNRQLDDSQQIKLVQESNLELHGIDVVPDNERTSTPKDIFFVFLGSQMCFGIIVLGSIPIALGLSFWNAVTSITVGLLIGSILFGLLAPFGAKTGTSGSTASIAHFGVKGRYIGIIMAIFTGFGFFALTVWTGGEALAASAARLFGWEITKNLMALGSAIIAAIIIFVAIYGHKFIVATEKFVSYLVAVILVIVGLTLFSGFDASYVGSTPALGTVAATWFLSVSLAAALPVSYGIFLNDYTRYLPTHVNTKKLIFAAGSGMFLGCWVALIFAAAVTTMFVTPDTPFVSGLINLVPWWAVLLLVIVGVIGSQPQGSLCIYGAGLGLQSIIPKMGRIFSTIILSVIGMLLVFIGIYLVDMVNMIIAFLTIDHCALAPWVVINVIGYFLVNRGEYDTDSLLYLSKNQNKSYWYTAGFNPSALIAWVSGFLVGSLFVHTDFYSGPLSDAFGGIGLDWVFAGAVGGIVFYVLERSAGRIK